MYLLFQRPRLFWHPRDLHVHNVGRPEGSAAPGGSSAFRLVERPVGLTLYGGPVPAELREYALLHMEAPLLEVCETPRSRRAAGPLDRLARVVRIPTVVDGCDVLLEQ